MSSDTNQTRSSCGGPSASVGRRACSERSRLSPAAIMITWNMGGTARPVAGTAIGGGDVGGCGRGRNDRAALRRRTCVCLGQTSKPFGLHNISDHTADRQRAAAATTTTAITTTTTAATSTAKAPGLEPRVCGHATRRQLRKRRRRTGQRPASVRVAAYEITSSAFT